MTFGKKWEIKSKRDSKMVFHLRWVYCHVQGASMHFATLIALSRSDVMWKCGEEPHIAVFTCWRILVVAWICGCLYTCVCWSGVEVRLGFVLLVRIQCMPLNFKQAKFLCICLDVCVWSGDMGTWARWPMSNYFLRGVCVFVCLSSHYLWNGRFLVMSKG